MDLLARGAMGPDPKTAIEKLRAEDPAEANPFPMWQRLQYARDMQGGRGRLFPLDNERYSSVHPVGVRAFLSLAFPA